jgi:hypothetical protein
MIPEPKTVILFDCGNHIIQKFMIFNVYDFIHIVNTNTRNYFIDIKISYRNNS